LHKSKNFGGLSRGSCEDKVPDGEDKVPDGEDKVPDGEDKVEVGQQNEDVTGREPRDSAST
jgi:hypothetical protein